MSSARYAIFAYVIFAYAIIAELLFTFLRISKGKILSRFFKTPLYSFFLIPKNFDFLADKFLHKKLFENIFYKAGLTGGSLLQKMPC